MTFKILGLVCALVVAGTCGITHAASLNALALVGAPSTPEPGTLGLLGLGALMLLRRQRKS